MNSKQIYIIRHGETEYNKLKLVQGSGIDAPLNELGHKQAKAFHQAFSNIPFDKVYTSKLQRTHQSVQPFIDGGLSWQQLEGLNEMSWGVKEGRIITSEDDRQHYEMVDGWKRGETYRKVTGGESPDEVKERQVVAWKYLMANDYEQNVLVCMHGRAMRILLCYLLQTSLKDMDLFEHKNLGLYLLKYDFAKNQYEIELSNYTDHLDEVMNEQEDISSNSFRK